MYYVVERLCGNSTQRVLTLNAQILNKYSAVMVFVITSLQIIKNKELIMYITLKTKQRLLMLTINKVFSKVLYLFRVHFFIFFTMG